MPVFAYRNIDNNNFYYQLTVFNTNFALYCKKNEHVSELDVQAKIEQVKQNDVVKILRVGLQKRKRIFRPLCGIRIEPYSSFCVANWYLVVSS